jgi:hypothetical protein
MFKAMTYDAKTLKLSHRTLKPKTPKHYLNPKPWPLNKTPWYPKVLDNENMFPIHIPSILYGTLVGASFTLEHERTCK